MVHDAFELVHTGPRRDITLGGLNASSVDVQSTTLTFGPMTYKSGSEDEELGLGRAIICSLDIPFPLLRIELGFNHDGVESAVLLDTNYLVDVIEVITQVLVVRVVVRPVPRVVYLGPGELVLRDLGIDTGAGIAVPSPGATCVVACLENGGLQTAIAEGLEHENTG